MSGTGIAESVALGVTEPVVSAGLVGGKGTESPALHMGERLRGNGRGRIELVVLLILEDGG
jgi:hypothetical protein